ncbi:MAG: NF038129 family PEP-CTERM protein, partial [Schlesneria sp.]
MRCVQVFKATFVASLAALLACASTSYAGTFHFEIDTSGLGSSPASAGAPFSLDLQFVDGGVLSNNTVQVSNFTYGGGAATGSATTAGGATGDIGSTVTFDNSSFFQELYQSFTPGTKLNFDVTLSQNVDGITPDSFVVAILDKDLLNIPTT